ncbi:MAG: twin-arginine translocase TatA/TatE family subunit [Thaumarchaeota archaeon]|nr:twin-arginine translocase TatA/TatE family subunit [Nitrososphaerota archaeon]
MGGSEWLWIALIVAVLLFGSKKLPEVARSIGKVMGEFQKGRLEIEREIKAATQEVTLSQAAQPTKKEEVQKAAAALGIDATSKSEEELKRAIKEKLA